MPRKAESTVGKRSKSAEPKTVAAKKTAAKKAAPVKAAAKKTAATKTTAKKTAAVKKAPAKKSIAKKGADTKSKKSREPEPVEIPAGSFEDPVGDVSSGEAHRLIIDEAEPHAMMEAYRADTTSEAERGLPEIEHDAEPAHEPDNDQREEGREPHLERLQKILSQAGIASRRHAEEMIVAGRVMVNGQVVTQLGAKADPARDHVRVDGKLIQGVERHRTFLLNKPKGIVTTVSDPEGRPTVMQFFEKLRERLYPVGRLDFQSEGLLLMTNDGELANAVTRAAAGVEKTYLVKVSGNPTEEELEQLRSGVRIDRDQPGSGKVHTAPASVRQIRPGENPWFEVILTEGRNRELRKMFQAVGHYVEKIRRVGYGPLVLDVEPGVFRELTPEEINALRLTAEGKLKSRRPKSSVMLPKEAGRPAEEWQKRRPGARPGAPRRDFRSRPDAGRDAGAPSFSRPRRESERSERPRSDKPFRPREERGEFRERSERPEARRFGGERGGRPFEKREGRSFGRPGGFDKPRGPRPDRPQFDRPRPEGAESDRSERPKFDRGEGRERFNRPREDRFAQRGPENRRSFGGRPERRGEFSGRTRPDRPRFDKPRFDRPDRGPSEEAGTRSFSRPGSPRTGPGSRGGHPPREEGGKPTGPRREFRSREGGFERSDRPKRFDRPGGASFSRPGSPRTGSGSRGGHPPREEGGKPGGPRREFRPREEGERGERPKRFDRPGGASFSRPRSGQPPREGSRFNRGKSRPGGFRGNRPGGPPRGDRG